MARRAKVPAGVAAAEKIVMVLVYMLLALARACAAKGYCSRSVCRSVVRGFGLWVSLSVRTRTIQATRRLMSDIYQQLQCYKGMKDNVPILLKTAFERYGVKTSEKPICIISTGLPRPGLARSAHRGLIN